MGSPTTEAVPAGERPGRSFLGRLLGVFVSPGETFADIARRPDFVAPLVLLTLSSVAVTESMLGKIGMARILRAALDQSGRYSSITPEQFQRAVNIQTIITHVSGALSFPFVLLVLAALGLLIVNVVFGAQVGFPKAFSVAGYACQVYLLELLMGVAMIFFGDPEHFNVRSFVPSNPGFFLDPLETSKVVMALASSLDVFTLWAMVLLGIGFSQATGKKVGAPKIFFVFLGLWVVWVAIKVGVAALF